MYIIAQSNEGAGGGYTLESSDGVSVWWLVHVGEMLCLKLLPQVIPIKGATHDPFDVWMCMT